MSTRSLAGARTALLMVGIVVIAANLRPALAGVGPLVADIRAATGLSNAMLGLLTTLPLLAFGVGSAFIPLVTRRLGIEGALAAGLVMLAAGTLIRSIDSVALLFGGTLLLGAGIALGNVLLPAIVKRNFPHRSGGMTSLYSSVMGLGATVAAGVSVPIAVSIGWRGSLGVWAVPAVIALVLWLPVLHGARTDARPVRTPGAGLRSLGRSRLAWLVALFMGLQSLTFYVVLAWLPDLLQSRGATAAEAGWMLALAQATGIAGSALVPLWAARVRDQQAIVWVLGGLEAVSLAGAIMPQLATLAVVWVPILGFVLGGTFGLSLLLLVLRAADAEAATELSGMAQAVGYLIAAAGPVLFGLLFDFTRGWTVPLLFLVVVLAAKVAVGLGAGRPGHVGTPRQLTAQKTGPSGP
ncbi:MFS transporter [soil metagenome]